MKEFATKHKHHLTLWIILLLITAVSGYFAFFYLPTGDHPTPYESSPKGRQGDKPTTTSLSTTTAIPASPTTTKVYTILDFLTQPKQENEPSIIIVTNSLNVETNTLTVTLEVNEQKYTLVYTNGDSLYTAMDKLKNETDFRFSGRDFGRSLGYFVEEINGVKNDRSNGKYWVYSINGEKAKIGVSNYLLKSNDIITWKYEDEIK